MTLFVASTITDLESKIAKVKSELDGLETSSKCDPDEIIQPSTPIFKQIFNAHAREQVHSSLLIIVLFFVF